MSLTVSRNIQKIVEDCRICQKFAKSVSRPKVTLPKASSFNEIVTLDLKSFGLKHILWIIDSFSRFLIGKVIQNKRADTIISAVIDMGMICLGIPIVGFYVDNGGEFVNIKILLWRAGCISQDTYLLYCYFQFFTTLSSY